MLLKEAFYEFRVIRSIVGIILTLRYFENGQCFIEHTSLAHDCILSRGHNSLIYKHRHVSGDQFACTIIKVQLFSHRYSYKMSAPRKFSHFNMKFDPIRTKNRHKKLKYFSKVRLSLF